MPIPSKKTRSISVNSVFIPQIVIASSIEAGEIQIHGFFLAAPAEVNVNGATTVAGEPISVSLPDLQHLDADIADAQDDVDAAMNHILAAIYKINQIRQIV